MRLVFSPEFKKSYKKLPKNLKNKVFKQLGFLQKNPSYPSLRVKKMVGFQNIWEARVTKGYRMCFSFGRNKIFMLTVGPHDKGLGKK